MGHIGAASGLGVMLGPAIGGVFSKWGLGVPGYVAAVLCALNGIAAIYFLPETRRHIERGKEHHGQAATLREWLHSMTRFPLSLLLGIYFLTISSFTAMTSVLALYLNKQFGTLEQQMAIVFTLAGGATVVVRGLMLTPIVKRVGENGTVRIGIVALAFAMVVMPVLPASWAIYFIVPIYAFGTGTLFPALATLVSRATDSHSQGSILGGSQVVGGLGRVVGPVWAGWLFQSVSVGSPFRVGAVLVALAGMLSFKMPSRVPAPTVSEQIEEITSGAAD
jgi:predicted MFS family arabinose efflux permease